MLVGSTAHLGLPPNRSRAQEECGFGETICLGGFGGDYCADTGSDRDNCGFCGNACTNGASCLFGRCEGGDRDDEDCGPRQELCPDGFSKGDLVCVNTSSDRDHCGGCGTVCPGTSDCFLGTCDCGPRQELCPDGFSKGDLVCVDTSSDRDHCGRCGTVCPSGTRCRLGVCAEEDGAGLPSTQDSAPFGIDTVTTTSLTVYRFEAALPVSFPGHVLMDDADTRAEATVLYEGVSSSRTWFYREPSETDDTVFVAVANVSRLDPEILMERFLGDLIEACGTISGCDIVRENSPTRSPVLYVHESYPFGTSGKVHSLVWSERDRDHVYTFRTMSLQRLEDLATGFVQNAKDLDSPPESPTPKGSPLCPEAALGR